MTMEEEALKIADYISKRRAKMKPSLHSLTNLGEPNETPPDDLSRTDYNFPPVIPD